MTEDAADPGGVIFAASAIAPIAKTLGERLADRVVAGYKDVIERSPPLFDVVHRGGDVVQAHDRDLLTTSRPKCN